MTRLHLQRKIYNYEIKEVNMLCKNPVCPASASLLVPDKGGSGLEQCFVTVMISISVTLDAEELHNKNLNI